MLKYMKLGKLSHTKNPGKFSKMKRPARVVSIGSLSLLIILAVFWVPGTPRQGLTILLQGKTWIYIIWTSMRENLSSGVWK